MDNPITNADIIEAHIEKLVNNIMVRDERLGKLNLTVMQVDKLKKTLITNISFAWHSSVSDASNNYKHEHFDEIQTAKANTNRKSKHGRRKKILNFLSILL